ncbi:hypothetical protein BV22DRAFT_566183 [Leucogyrophana mollusca]|uniref:Uncharacterized protein n=1 Tax=Leucogyrophana mollusca TaxID=85980 RepID=A0ACB8BFQ3_9AGAM|nr:hypothetical protein BV22DRAFT_566183 [Leucogyrophana mollusca]
MSVANNLTSVCLRLYMNHHPDMLVACVKYFGKVNGDVTTAEVDSIDTKGTTLTYKLRSGENQSVRIKFDPPLTGFQDVKPRLLSLSKEAQKCLGMTEAPQITTLRIHFSAFVPFICFSIVVLYITEALPGTQALFTPARWLKQATGMTFSANSILGGTIVIHAVEALYTYSLCKKYVKGGFLTAAHLLLTVVFGYPVLATLKRRVQVARIESIIN